MRPKSELKLSMIVAGLPSLTPFVAPESLERRLGVKFRVRLGANESVFGASPLAVAAMTEQANQSQWYGDPQAAELRNALAERVGGELENFVIGPGIDGLLIHVARAYLEPGRVAITTLGSYPTFEYAVAGTGAECVRVPYRDDAVDLDGLAAAAQEHTAAMVYVANPDNPSGTRHSPEAIRVFRTKLPASTLLVLDEAYADFLTHEQLLPFDSEDTGIFRLRTFSKAHGLAGLRVGYAFGAEETVEPLHRIRSHFEVNSVGLEGALASLSDPAFLSDVITQARAGRQELAEIFGDFGVSTLPSSTNFVLADLGSRERAEKLLNDLLRAGVFVRKPGLAPLDRCVRVTVGRPQEHAILRDVLQHIHF